MGFIELKEIQKTFQTKQGNIRALDGVDLSIEKGDIYGIVGYSGAGKSTLVRLLNGLETATSGQVVVDGKEVSALKGKPLRSYRKKVGMIFQHFNLLWSRTVLKNIELPLEMSGVPKEKREEKAQELLKLVGLEGKGDSYPQELSGGQKQRVGIARALANEPEILLSDESTSALDPQTTDEVLDLLLHINQELGLTIVMITHEMHVIRKIATKVAVMGNGKVIEEGSVHEVFQNPQTSVAKKFVTQELDPEHKETEHFLKEISSKNPNGKIVELLFEEEANEPVIARTIRQHNVDISVLAGHLKQTNIGGIGALTVLMTGEENEIDNALLFIQSVGVKTEVKNIGE